MDNRKQQLQDMAKKYNFDLNQKLYGVFAYRQQPGCHGCYLLTANADQALKLKKRLVHAGYGDYDATGFCVEQETVENLMLKYTTWSAAQGYSIMFPDFLKKFKQFLQRLATTEAQSAAVDFSERLSAISLTISDLEDCYDDLPTSQQADVIHQMTSIRDKIETFFAENAADAEESSLEW